MSHTDKTRPAWVQFRDPHNRRFMEEVHNHHKGTCDLDEWLQSECDWVPYIKRWFHCYLTHSYYRAWHCEFRERHGHRFNQWRKARAAWRRQRSQLLSGDLDGDALLVPRHRQYDSWRQEVWYD